MKLDFGKLVVLATLIAIASLSVYASFFEKADPFANAPPGFREVMKKSFEQADKDFDGPLGQRAREACSSALGIPRTAMTARDVLPRYGVEKATAWMECVVDRMYPVN